MKTITRSVVINITSTKEAMQSDFAYIVKEISDGNITGFNHRGADVSYSFEVRDELGNYTNLDT